MVYLKYWTLHFKPLMVYPKVLFPLNCQVLLWGDVTLKSQGCPGFVSASRHRIVKKGKAKSGAHAMQILFDSSDCKVWIDRQQGRKRGQISTGAMDQEGEPP